MTNAVLPPHPSPAASAAAINRAGKHLKQLRPPKIPFPLPRSQRRRIGPFVGLLRLRGRQLLARMAMTSASQHPYSLA
jgi:hypothetical protein